MQTQQAKQLSLPDLLGRIGYKPVKVSAKKLWYKSPLHDERTPSFCVEPGHTVAWIFSDHGINVKGNILDFVMHYQGCDLKEALAWLSRIYGESKKQYFIPLYQQSQTAVQKFQITSVTKIQHPALISYLNQRAIPISLARQYLSEVHYLNCKQSRFALGWKTDNGGWCLRADKFKAFICPAGITTLGVISDQLSIFEGMFDALSALAYYQIDTSFQHIIILNSVSYISAAIEKIGKENYQRIQLYLDNDLAGRKATQQLLILRNATDCSSIFSPWKDFSEWFESDRLKKVSDR